MRNVIKPGRHRDFARLGLIQLPSAPTVHEPPARFGVWTRPVRPEHGWRVMIVELHSSSQFTLVRRDVSGAWATALPVIERAERVSERLNRSKLAVAASELDSGGLQKLAEQLWKEDEDDYAKNA